MAEFTLAQVVESKLREFVSTDLKVVEQGASSCEEPIGDGPSCAKATEG